MGVRGTRTTKSGRAGAPKAKSTPGPGRPRGAKSKWKPAPAALVTLFETAVEVLPGAELRRMFGCPAAFVNGNMLGGLFEDRMMLRLSPDDLARFRAETGAALFEPMPGRAMREYVELPKAVLGSPSRRAALLAQAFAHVRSLPAKAGAKRKKAAPTGSGRRSGKA